MIALKTISTRMFLIPAALLAAGCASSTNFRNSVTGYTGQARDFQYALASGDNGRIDHVADSLDGECKSADKILYLEERGRLRSLSGDLKGSIADYQIASDVFENTRMKAVLSVSDTYFTATAIASNDLAIPYEGYGFEKVMLHNLQAVNYLLDGNYDFARIELNHADVEQQYSLQQHQKLVAQAESQRQSQNLDTATARGTLSEKSSQNVFGAGAVKNSFQNAFTFHLRGCLFEDSGDYDKALIEYKKALDIYPGNRFVAEAAMRTARLCGATRDQKDLVNAYGNALRGDPCPADSGRLVVVFETGFVQSRSTFRLPFVWDSKIIELVLPFYDMGGYRPSDELDIAASGAGACTQTICNLDAMAVRSLDEIYDAVLVRQILRMIAKYRMQDASGTGALGVLVRVASIVTDRIDDRNWLTLPQSVQIAELFLPAGQQNVTCSCFGMSKNVSLDIKPGKTQFLVVTQLGSTLVARSGDVVGAAALQK